MSVKRVVVGVLIGVVVVAGWIVAGIFWGLQQETKARLAATEAELSTKSEAVSAIGRELGGLKEDAGSIDDLLALIQSRRDEFDVIQGKLDEAKDALSTASADLDAKKQELDRVTDEIAAKAGLVSNLQGQADVYDKIEAGKPFLTTDYVNLRSKPTQKSEIILVLPPDREVEVLDVVEGGQWFEVGGIGYIFHSLLKPAPENAGSESSAPAQ